MEHLIMLANGHQILSTSLVEKTEAASAILMQRGIEVTACFSKAVQPAIKDGDAILSIHSEIELNEEVKDALSSAGISYVFEECIQPFYKIMKLKFN